jgi:hypothetical protein
VTDSARGVWRQLEGDATAGDRPLAARGCFAPSPGEGIVHSRVPFVTMPDQRALSYGGNHEPSYT